jgi:hypothetical protein
LSQIKANFSAGRYSREVADPEGGATDANSKIDACPPINGVRSKPSSTFSTVNA